MIAVGSSRGSLAPSSASRSLWSSHIDAISRWSRLERRTDSGCTWRRVWAAQRMGRAGGALASCLSSHGPDEKQRKAKLRPDTRNGAASVIVAGKPAESELIARIMSDEPSMIMPPAKSGKVLKPQQKQILRKWIEQGAQHAIHWAFV